MQILFGIFQILLQRNSCMQQTFEMLDISSLPISLLQTEKIA